VGLKKQRRIRQDASATQTHPSPKGGEEWGTQKRKAKKSKGNRRSLGCASFGAQDKRDDTKSGKAIDLCMKNENESREREVT
jgi:hypothetical protein